MAEGTEGELNFDSANLENAASHAARELEVLRDYVIPLAALVLFFLTIYFSIRVWKRLSSGDPQKDYMRMTDLPVALRVATLPLLAGYALTHAFAAGSVYYNTLVANASTMSYFEVMGRGRLFSLSHAHLFAHATMYFILAALVQLSGRKFVPTVLAPMAALWAGVFDVFSWWGLKEVSPNFEWLSIACGSIFSLGFLVMAYAIIRSALCSSANSTKA